MIDITAEIKITNGHKLSHEQKQTFALWLVKIANYISENRLMSEPLCDAISMKVYESELEERLANLGLTPEQWNKISADLK